MTNNASFAKSVEVVKVWVELPAVPHTRDETISEVLALLVMPEDL